MTKFIQVLNFSESPVWHPSCWSSI